MEAAASMPVVVLMTRPNPRICAAAHRTDPGTSRITVSRSTPGEKRSRNRSPKVTSPRRQSGTAKNNPMMTMPTA